MNEEILCQKCGEPCKETNEKFYGNSELGFRVPVTIYICEKCNTKHIICPDCNGEKFKINYRSASIFEDVDDCPTCLGMGSIMIGDLFNA